MGYPKDDRCPQLSDKELKILIEAVERLAQIWKEYISNFTGTMNGVRIIKGRCACVLIPSEEFKKEKEKGG